MQLRHILLALLVALLWGVNFVVIKVGLDEISPLLLVSARFFLTSLPLVFFIKRPALPFLWVVAYGLVMFALQFALLFIGMQVGVTPGLASLLLQFQVFFTMLLGAIFMRERVSVWQVMGALIAFAGMACLVLHLGASVTLTGFLLVIGAALAWGGGNVISKKMGKVDMMGLVSWASLVAWPPLFGVTLWFEGLDYVLNTLSNLTWLSWGAVLYITYVSTLFGFGVWSHLLHRYPLGVVAPFSLLVPVFGMVSSILLLHEPFGFWKRVAMLLVMGGVCLNLMGPRLLAKCRGGRPIDL